MLAFFIFFAQDRHTACCTSVVHRLRRYCDVQLLSKYTLVAAMALSMQKTALVQTPMVSRVSSRSQAARAAVPRGQVHLTGSQSYTQYVDGEVDGRVCPLPHTLSCQPAQPFQWWSPALATSWHSMQLPSSIGLQGLMCHSVEAAIGALSGVLLGNAS